MGKVTHIQILHKIFMGNHKICFFNRSSIHYRKNIYLLMDKELHCDFYFGDSRPGGIKPMDTSLLRNFKGTLHNRKVIGSWFWQSGVLGLLNKGYTDIITPGETYCLSTWLLLLLAKVRGVRVFLWTHGAYGDEKGFKKWMTKVRVKLSAGAFLYGEYAKRVLVGYGCDERKLHVIYNSLDYDTQKQMRTNIKASKIYKDRFFNNNTNVVFIGRLTKEKKLKMLLESIVILKRHNININVTFIGDGIMRSQLEELTSELGLQDTVWFYGALYDEKKIAEFLYNADLCVSPGNVGLTAMHAMTFGCPVISHNNFPKQMPEFEAIEPGKTGTFFRENDVESLAEAIKSWFSGVTNREAVRKECYKVIDEKYNPHKQVETLRSIIYKQ